MNGAMSVLTKKMSNKLILKDFVILHNKKQEISYATAIANEDVTHDYIHQVATYYYTEIRLFLSK